MLRRRLTVLMFALYGLVAPAVGTAHVLPPPGIADFPSATATWTYAWNQRGLIESEQVVIDGLTFVINPTYDSLGHLSSLRYPKAGDNDNLTAITDHTSWNDDRSMAYDGLDRLQYASGPWGSFEYVYDPLNNLRQVISSSSTPGISRSYGYNARGEVTSDGSFSFTRNDAGQITVVSGLGSFAYDGNSKRIKTVINNTTEYHVYDLGGRLIQTYRPATSQRSDYFTLQGQTILQIDKTGSGSDVPTYFAVDLLGSPVTASNASGTVLWHERYGPYGEKLEDQDSNLGYTGHEHDYETGLTYAQARFYDGQVGRFIETDPVHFTGEPFSFNRYAYANNNPYKYTDPNGQQGEFALLRLVAAGAAADAMTPDPSDAAAPIKGAIYTGALVGAALGGTANLIINAISENSNDSQPSDSTGKRFSKEKEALVDMAKQDKNQVAFPSPI